MMLSTIDIALRGATVALLLVLAASLFRGFGTVLAGRLAAAFALGSAAHAVSYSIGATSPVSIAHTPVIALSTGNVVVFWLFTRALFDEAFKLRWWHGLIWAAVAAFSFVNCMWIAPASGARLSIIAINLIALGFIALAVTQTVASWPSDLAERRRSGKRRGRGRLQRGRPETHRCAAADGRRAHLPPRQRDHRHAGDQARNSRIQIAAADQPAARLPQLQCVPQCAPDRRSQGRARRSEPGRSACDHDRDGCRLPVAGTFQPRLQDHHWPRDAFFAKGTIGQYVIIVPSERLVIVRLGRSPNWPPEADGVFDLMRDVVAATGSKGKLAVTN